MKHRRGIDLRTKAGEIVYLGLLPDPVNTTFADIPDWHVLGGYCTECEHEGWLNRWDLSQMWNSGAYLASLAPRLRCRACGHKGTNKWVLGRLPR